VDLPYQALVFNYDVSDHAVECSASLDLQIFAALVDHLQDFVDQLALRFTIAFEY